MNNILKLSRLMKISWEIQQLRGVTRSKALAAAWAICNNEDVTVFYLTQKLNHYKPVKTQVQNQYSLFK